MLRAFRIEFALLFAIAACVFANPSFAQPGGGRGFGGGGFGGPGGGLAGLLASEDVQQEIELMDDQRDELQAMGEELRDQMRAMFEDMRDLSAEERRERFATMREDMQAIQAQGEGRLEEILLPHQIKRLKEVNLQQQVRQRGVQGALSGDLGEELGITSAQQEEMATKAQELQQEMQEKIEQMRKEAQDELMNILTPQQQSKLKSLMGSEFEMQPRGFGRFGGRGRPGERGRPGRGS